MDSDEFQRELKARYSDLANHYDDLVTKMAAYTAHERIPRRIIELSRACGTLRVLDAGCGTGLSSVHFFDLSAQVTGIDLAPGMIEQARKRPFERLICQSLDEPWDVPDSDFNVVIALGLTEFIEDIHALMTNIARKLVVGGICGVTFAKPLPPTCRLQIKTYEAAECETAIEVGKFLILELLEFPGYIKCGEQVEYRGYILRKPCMY